MGDHIYTPVMQVFDSDGDPGVGYKLYTYESGTSTPKVVYTDEACTVDAANPVVFDSRGEATIYYADEYKFILKTDADVTVWTVDGVGTAATSSSSTTYAYYPDPAEADQGVTASGTGDTIYDIITEVGTSEHAKIILRHNGDSSTSTYTLDTSIDLTLYPFLFIEVDPGAQLVRTTGDELLTLHTPSHIIARPNQQITIVDMLRFVEGGTVHASWFGSGTSAAQYAVNTLTAGGELVFSNGTYTSLKITIAQSIRVTVLEGATLKLADSTDDSLIYVDTVDRFDLDGGGIIDGNKANNSTANGTVETTSAGIVNIGNITIKDSDGSAVSITSAEKGIITPIITNADGHGIAVVDSDNLYIWPDIDTVEFSGVLITPTAAHCNRITVGGIIKDAAVTGTPHVGVYFNSGDTYAVRYSSISSIVENAGYLGILPNGDYNTVTDACRVNTTGAVTTANAHGIWVHDSSHISIGAAIVSNAEKTGILVNKSHNVTLTGTIVYRSGDSGFWFDYDVAASGRYQGDATNKSAVCSGCVAIENSQGSGTTWPGFYIDGFRSLSFVGCHAHDYQDTETQARGIVANTHASTADISVVGCDFTDNDSAYGINIARAYLSKCQGNNPSVFDFIEMDGSDWDDYPLVIGSYYLWVDATGDLRIKSGAPTSGTDGTIVGTQS